MPSITWLDTLICSVLFRITTHLHFHFIKHRCTSFRSKLLVWGLYASQRIVFLYLFVKFSWVIIGCQMPIICSAWFALVIFQLYSSACTKIICPDILSLSCLLFLLVLLLPCNGLHHIVSVLILCHTSPLQYYVLFSNQSLSTQLHRRDFWDR